MYVLKGLKMISIKLSLQFLLSVVGLMYFSWFFVINIIKIEKEIDHIHKMKEFNRYLETRHSIYIDSEKGGQK